MTYTTDYTLHNDLILMQKISYSDIQHKNANYLYFETHAMTKTIAEHVVYLIVKNLRQNNIFIDFAMFKKSFMKHYTKRYFILKLDWKNELSMNQPLLLNLIDKNMLDKLNSGLDKIDRQTNQLLFTLQNKTF